MCQPCVCSYTESIGGITDLLQKGVLCWTRLPSVLPTCPPSLESLSATQGSSSSVHRRPRNCAEAELMSARFSGVHSLRRISSNPFWKDGSPRTELRETVWAHSVELARAALPVWIRSGIDTAPRQLPPAINPCRELSFLIRAYEFPVPAYT